MICETVRSTCIQSSKHWGSLVEIDFSSLLQIMHAKHANISSACITTQLVDESPTTNLTVCALSETYREIWTDPAADLPFHMRDISLVIGPLLLSTHLGSFRRFRHPSYSGVRRPPVVKYHCFETCYTVLAELLVYGGLSGRVENAEVHMWSYPLLMSFLLLGVLS
jgi:hypothetical protein